MDPVRTDRTNAVYDHGEPHIDDLPVFADMEEEKGHMICKSYWRPTTDELALLIAGGAVRVSIRDMQPAVRVDVSDD